jgi:uncharacterized RDD family membrane protein YckC
MKPDTSPGLSRRLAALIYDTFLVIALIMLNVAIATVLQDAMSDAKHANRAASSILHPQLVQAIAILSSCAFYSAFWRIKGQTLGMQAWRIRLRPFPGDPQLPAISVPQAVLRCAGALLSLLPLGMGYWWCLFDRNGRYWHDYLSRSELVLTARNSD